MEFTQHALDFMAQREIPVARAERVVANPGLRALRPQRFRKLNDYTVKSKNSAIGFCVLPSTHTLVLGGSLQDVL